MLIKEYKYLAGTEKRDGYYAIPEMSRNDPCTPQYQKLLNLNIELTAKTAFIYVDGFSLSQAEPVFADGPKDLYVPAIKNGVSFMAHEWMRSFKNPQMITNFEIISSTCAAGIQAIKSAENFLSSKEVDEVIIIAAERTTFNTLRLFKELRIPIMCGDAFVYMKLVKGENTTSFPRVVDAKWKFNFENNPFYFTRETLDNLIPKYNVDYVKLHGTGTKSNSVAEAGIAQLGKTIIYKDRIGHTQGASSLVETCMVLDNDKVSGNILVTANGLGGFYGSFLLVK